MTHIIAITGMMGSGKSTLVKQLQAMLPDCAALFEDDYNPAPNRSLDDIQDWWDRGADVGEFDLSLLADQLMARCPERADAFFSGADIDEPDALTFGAVDADRGRTAANKLILLETQFGRLHPTIAPWIDFQCWVDVPSDVAFARKVAQLSRQLLHDPAASTGSMGLQWIAGFCDGYLNTTRTLFEMQRQQVSGQADASINGMGTPLDTCGRLLAVMPEQFHRAA